MNTDLLDIEREHALPEVRETRPATRRSPWVIGAFVGIMSAATLGSVIVNEVQTSTRFDQARSSLEVTRQHIAHVSADLIAVRHRLGVANGQLRTNSASLADDISQLQTARKAMAEDASQLHAARKLLASAQTHVSDQTSTIGDVQACLGGVEQALNASAVDDQRSTINALQAVSASCAKAVTTNG
jgi:chromosome segregation ATPase